MNQALLLLNNSDYNVQTIAEKVGYTNAGHFSGLFDDMIVLHFFQKFAVSFISSINNFSSVERILWHSKEETRLSFSQIPK